MNYFAAECQQKYGEPRVYPSDEFYILAGREIPPAAHYGDFLQLENGVGMWALFKREAERAISTLNQPVLDENRTISIATGESAFPLIQNVVDMVQEKWHNLNCKVYKIKNRFFGGKITVTGLLTGNDLVQALKGQNLGQELFISATMLRNERDMFLDNMTLPELEQALGVKVTVVENDGYDLVEKLLFKETEV